MDPIAAFAAAAVATTAAVAAAAAVDSAAAVATASQRADSQVSQIVSSGGDWLPMRE